MGSHSRFNTAFRGVASTKRSLGKPAWHIKRALFVCKVAALSTPWGLFCTERARKHQICPMNATKDAKQRNFVMDRQCLIHPFGQPFPIEAFPSSPPSSLSCEFIYLKNGEKFYKRKTNVEDSIAQLRKARVSS